MNRTLSPAAGRVIEFRPADGVGYIVTGAEAAAVALVVDGPDAADPDQREYRVPGVRLAAVLAAVIRAGWGVVVVGEFGEGVGS